MGGLAVVETIRPAVRVSVSYGYPGVIRPGEGPYGRCSSSGGVVDRIDSFAAKRGIKRTDAVREMVQAVIEMGGLDD